MATHSHYIAKRKRTANSDDSGVEEWVMVCQKGSDGCVFSGSMAKEQNTHVSTWFIPARLLHVEFFQNEPPSTNWIQYFAMRSKSPELEDDDLCMFVTVCCVNLLKYNANPESDEDELSAMAGCDYGIPFVTKQVKEDIKEMYTKMRGLAIPCFPLDSRDCGSYPKKVVARLFIDDV